MVVRGHPPSRLDIQLEQGWYWASVNHGVTLHLVPPQPGPLSRTACGALPLAGQVVEQTVMVLFDEPAHCKTCRGDRRAAR